MNNYVHVAVGVVRNQAGEVLLAKRRDDAHQGGLWEFPGGKVEAGEAVQDALGRELAEELAIEMTHSLPLIQVRHHYHDKSVLLDVWEVDGYRGTPKGNEGQPLEWVATGRLAPGSECQYPLPAANAAIIKALLLPDTLLVTGEFENKRDFLIRCERALQNGVRLVQIRGSASMEVLSEPERRELLEQVCALCSQYDAQVVINTAVNFSPDAVYGFHLPASQLMTCTSRPLEARLFGASCHNRQELQRAEELGCDYALLSPVKVTPSHPEATPLGWDQFQSMIQAVNIPVYALGGLTANDVEQARNTGGQGVAGINAFWKPESLRSTVYSRQ